MAPIIRLTLSSTIIVAFCLAVPVQANPGVPAGAVDGRAAANPDRHAIAVELNNSGVHRMVNLDYKGAVKDLDEAIAADPKYGLAFVNRGLAKEKLADRQGAIFDYSEAIRINPTNVSGQSGYFLRARCEQECGDYRMAIADYTVLMKLDSTDAYQYLHQRALAKEKLGDKIGAIDDLQKEKAIRASQRI